MSNVTTAAGTFIDWLRRQHTRKDLVGELARSVRSDPRSARLSTALDLSKRLNQDEASWEFHDALEQAEGEWLREALD
ncbi:hypothetical protein EAO27_13335 [Sphingopyxis sp. YF1]|uniref:hypothetical protein n=1 Tax=Sphingopyxis sp. YF1 TaxID=2482763 RepID=UPI001F614A92|nr:hypothetical protein [Sphingopyxis sp. YF1]UNU43591.1 hypothetical protein EAO27_13335 [Sphingopyxis sp. YF1]